jgi:NAD(P)H-nitrite reductase large subunit
MAEEVIVCHCMGVTLEEIWKAIEEGHCDIDSIGEATGAGTACGLCRSVEDDPNHEREIHIEDILKEAKAKGICKG